MEDSPTSTVISIGSICGSPDRRFVVRPNFLYISLMFPTPFVRSLLLSITGLACVAHGLSAVEGPPTSLPSALRSANSRWISSGLYSALTVQGAFGGTTTRRRALAANGSVVDLSKGKPPAVLDARIGVNVRLGDDPAALPTAQRGQAEPHITRSAANPEVLLATFQEGRFATNGGSIDCGYALSTDGGLTWRRTLIPNLTVASGGIYHRATDPVAGIGPQGDLYLATLGSLDDAFGNVALVVSRSTDGGATWAAPSVAFQQTTAQASPDKDWLAVNDFPGTANPGRLVATWTNFTSNAAGAATGNNLLATTSDDRGATWSAPAAITPAGSLNQGTQPVFLPDGSLAVIYITFANANTATFFSIQCKRSLDGGRTFPAASTTIVGLVNGFDDPDLRNGIFLPSATVARATGDLVVSYVALVAGTPRVMVTKSSDKGTTWSTPIVASDNPIGSAVENPAVAVTPDGQTISVMFMDKRLTATDATGHNFFIDYYGAQSFDGGATWQPNLRLSEMTSDIRYSPLTSEGYMLGDYLGIASALSFSAATNLWDACVAIWCDTRTGDADPFTTRLAPAGTANFLSWGVAQHVSTFSQSDSDQDGDLNLLEYGNGTNPLLNESGEALFIARRAPDTVDLVWTQREAPLADSRVGTAVLAINPDLGKFVRYAQVQLQLSFTLAAGKPLSADQLPPVTPRQGLAWVGLRFTVLPNVIVAGARTVTITNGLGRLIDGPVTTIGTDSRFINLSTRGPILPGGAPMAAGFVVRGGSRSLLIRGVGPSLAPFGIANFATDPWMAVFAAGGTAALTFNNGWFSSGKAIVQFIAATALQVGAFPLNEPSGKDDALLFTTAASAGYSAQIRNAATSGGSTALVEVYDTPTDSTGLLVNLSTLGQVTASDSALIAGFVIGGTQPRRVLLRAVGPSLAQFGTTGILIDPVLTLYHGNTIIAANDDWEISRSSAAIAATAQNVGAFALNSASLDAALLITLAPGAYTAVVTGANGATGTTLVEIYDAN